jgi:hypothetical protein
MEIVLAVIAGLIVGVIGGAVGGVIIYRKFAVAVEESVSKAVAMRDAIEAKVIELKGKVG